MFKPIPTKVHFPDLEKELLDYWKQKKIFERSVAERVDKEFTFYDGPPFATGLPHYGHILAGVIKDVVPRYWTMKGYKVERRFGWDCHGLPVENIKEQELGISGKKDIEEMGVAAFNEACRGIVQRYVQEWRAVVERTGRWVDMDHDYKTMDTSYMETIWWVFKQLWDKELVYEGYKSMHICPRCVTPLSNFEVTQGYKDITDASVTAKFKLDGEENTYVLAWTTTPWTLPGNMALAVGAEIEYVKVMVWNKEQKKFEHIILAKDIYEREKIEKRWDMFLLSHTKEGEPIASYPKVVSTLKGEELVGKTYEPLFPYFSDKKKEGAFRIVAADFVSTEDGTGVVHIAPGYGEDDYNLSVQEHLPLIQHVGMDGRFTNDVVEYAGQEVKPKDDHRKMDMKMADYLEQHGTLFARVNYPHSYPHCWRCETPLLNYATTSWFVSVTKLKDKLLQNNEKVYWFPESMKYGRFGKWLENVRDWAISRNRFWGAPLPLWRCDSCKNIEVIGSLEELMQKVPDRIRKEGTLPGLSGHPSQEGNRYIDTRSGKEFDLHKHIVDELTWQCSAKKCSGIMRRIPEVLDCWFESGSMPYAQEHYPFENKEKFERNFPANFIAEGQDQTRGWFYTLHVLATALTMGPKPSIPVKRTSPAFQNVIVNGIVLAEDGKKMSKRLKNYPDPTYILDTYGADAMRFYLMSSSAVQAQDLRFSEKGVDEVVKSVILPFWHAYSFFVTYANIDQFTGDSLQGTAKGKGQEARKFSNKLDQWLLSDLQATVQKVTERLDAYDLAGATYPLLDFLDGLTNWYIRRSRRRFWKSENDTDKKEAYAALYTTLTTLAQLLAPFTPFVAEEVYRNLTSADSVHLSLWPTVQKKWLNPELNAEIDIVRQVVRLGLAARAKSKIKVRQPLALIEVVVPEKMKEVVRMYREVILEELNVKDLKLLDESTEVARKIIKPIGAIVGPKFGKDTQQVIANAKAGKFREKQETRGEGRGAENEKLKVKSEKLDFKSQEVEVVEYVVLGDAGQEWVLAANEVEVHYEGKEGFDVESDGGVVVALDTKVTENLKTEGIAREIVRTIQDMRKEAGYQVSDRIQISLAGCAADVLHTFGDYIRSETLATKITELAEFDLERELELEEGEKVTVRVRR